MRILNAMTAITVLSSTTMLCLVPMLPDSVPVHISFRGDVDQDGSKWVAAVGPVLTLLIAGGFQLLVRRTINKPPDSLRTVFSVALGVMIGWCWIFYFIAKGVESRIMADIIILYIGSWMIFIGRYIGSVKPNNFVGIRTKWTLLDEEVWQRTHRFGRCLMMACGSFILLAAAIGYCFNARTASVVMVAVALVSLLSPVPYSYLLYIKKNRS